MGHASLRRKRVTVWMRATGSGPMNRRLPFAFGLMLLPWTGSQAAQLPYPVDIERQHGSTLVIEHTPVAAVVGVHGIQRTKVVVRKHRVHRIRRTVVVRRYRINP